METLQREYLRALVADIEVVLNLDPYDPDAQLLRDLMESDKDDLSI